MTTLGMPTFASVSIRPASRAGGYESRLKRTRSGWSSTAFSTLKRAGLRAAEDRDLGQARELLLILDVAVIVGGAEIVAPADDPLERVVSVQRGDDVHLAAFGQDHALDRGLDGDGPADDVGDGGGALGRGASSGRHGLEDGRERQGKEQDRASICP